MAEGKWIQNLNAETPLADAARHVLTVRFDVVRHYLPLALEQADQDVEYVHQLRVGTRRARAALDLFSLCLPAKVYRAAKKELRKIRRAAGEARDWDVFLEELGKPVARRPAKHRPGLDFLLGYAMAQRRVAQGVLEKSNQIYPFAFSRCVAETIAAVETPGEGNYRVLVDLAKPTLTNLVRDLDLEASENLEDYNHLHQVRILGKKLRYAMEIFADCFLPAFKEEVYPAIEQMQEILGRANDSHVAVGRLMDLLQRTESLPARDAARLKPGIEGLLKFHGNRLPCERQQFLSWWENWQRTGSEKAFLGLLR